MTPTPARCGIPIHTISIVTPNFNTAEFLGETMQSVLMQGYPKLQYVVADGGSDDGSLEIVERHRDRLHGVISGPDAGHADAINRGFALTSGELMGWINSDDVLHEGSLATLDAIFAAFPEVDWISGIPTTALGGGRSGPTRFKVRSSRAFTYGDFLAGDYRWLQQESTFWRRSLWERAGGALDTGLRLAVDFELWMRFFRHARLHTVEALLGAFRRREGQRSAVLLEDYLDEARSVIARENEGLRAGGIVVPDGALRRTKVGVRRPRLMRRVLPEGSPFAITRVEVEAARMSRWADWIGASGVVEPQP